MGIIAAILSAIVEFIGSGAFSNITHALFTSLGKQEPAQVEADANIALQLAQQGQEIAQIVAALTSGGTDLAHAHMLAAAATVHVANNPPAAPTA